MALLRQPTSTDVSFAWLVSRQARPLFPSPRGEKEAISILDAQGSPAFQIFYFPPEFRRMTYLSITPGSQLWSLDNLVISEVPEPSALALMALGGLALFLKRRMPYSRRHHEPSVPAVIEDRLCNHHAPSLPSSCHPVF